MLDMESMDTGYMGYKSETLDKPNRQGNHTGKVDTLHQARMLVELPLLAQWLTSWLVWGTPLEDVLRLQIDSFVRIARAPMPYVAAFHDNAALIG